MKFEEPVMEVIELEATDMITTLSGAESGSDGTLTTTSWKN